MFWVVWESLVPSVFSDIVLFIVDEIPSINKMMDQVANTRSSQADRDVGPSHSAALGAIELILKRMVDFGEIHYSSIVEVLTRENDLVQIRRMRICDWMLIRIPSSET